MLFSADGQAHGVLMWNSNAMDVVLHPEWVSFRLTGGIVDLFILLGPTPRDVIEQYTRLIGRPAMPPLWALGFHQSKYSPFPNYALARLLYKRTHMHVRMNKLIGLDCFACLHTRC
jgi:alpha-glucosidase (family GH31 glycosyl hydrolase)